MHPKLKEIFWRWLKNVAGLYVAAHLVSGIYWNNAATFLLATLSLSLLHVYVRPAVKLFLGPLIFMTLGMVILLANAGYLYLTGWFLKPEFVVATWSSAFWGGVIIMIVSGMVFVATKVFLGAQVLHETIRPMAGAMPRQDKTKTAQAPSGPPPGTGPVIDI